MAMIAQGDPILRGRHFEVDHAAELPIGHLHRLHARLSTVDLQDLLARLVANQDKALAVIEPISQAVANSVALAMLQNRTFMVVETEGFAPGGDGQGASFWIQAGAVHEAPRIHEFAIALNPGAAIRHVDDLCRVRRHIIDVQVRAGMVDDALAIGTGVANIIIFVIRVPAQVGAVRKYAVQIADSFVVAHKVNAAVAVVRILGNPHRGSDVASQFRQETLELSLAFEIDPELARSAASIAFPAGRIPQIAAQDGQTGWAEGDGPRRAVGQALRFTCLRIGRNLVEKILSAICGAVRTGKNDLSAVLVPTQDPAVAA